MLTMVSCDGDRVGSRRRTAEVNATTVHEGGEHQAQVGMAPGKLQRGPARLAREAGVKAWEAVGETTFLEGTGGGGSAFTD